MGNNNNFSIQLDINFESQSNIENKLKNIISGLNSLSNKKIQLDVEFKNTDFTQQLNQLNSLVEKTSAGFKTAFNGIDTGKLKEAIALTEKISNITGLTAGTHNADMFPKDKLIQSEIQVDKIVKTYEDLGYKVKILNEQGFVSNENLSKIRNFTLELEKQDGILHKMTYSRPTVATNGTETPFTLTGLKSTDNSAELIKAQQKALESQQKAQQELASEAEKANKQKIAEEQSYQREIEKTISLMTKQIDAMAKNNILPDSNINNLRNQVSGLSIKSDETQFETVNKNISESIVLEQNLSKAIIETQNATKRMTQEQISRGKATYDLIAQEQKAEQEQQKLSDAANQYAQKTNIAIDNLKTKYGGSIPTKELDELRTRLESISNLSVGGKSITSMEQLRQVIKETQIDYAKLDSLTRSNANSFGATMLSDMQKFAMYFVGGGAMVTAINSIKEGIQTINELNSAITTINMTMNMSAGDMQKLTSQSQALAQQMGISISEVLNAVKVYANANETVDSILAKTKADIMLATASGMSTDNTTDAINLCGMVV